MGSAVQEDCDQFSGVVDFYRLSGDVDYLIRAVASDIRAHDDLYQRLIAKIDLYARSSRPQGDFDHIEVRRFILNGATRA
jgi:DNA-binding Lrp family transcriptional regulator